MQVNYWRYQDFIIDEFYFKIFIRNFILNNDILKFSENKKKYIDILEKLGKKLKICFLVQ